MTAYIVLLAAISFGQTSDLNHAATFDAGLRFPGRLAPAPGGGVYVTDQPSGKVIQYDAAGAVAGTYEIPELPVGIATHPDGRVLVSRQDGEVGIYDGSFVLQGTLDPAPLTMTAPNDLAVHPVSGDVFVADSGGHQILVFHEDAGVWQLAGAWGTAGSGLSEFQSPQAIAIDPATDLVIVADVDNFRVQVFDIDGVLQFKFGYRTLYLPSGDDLGWFARSEGLAVDPCGNIHIADALMGTVRAFSPTGKELDSSFLPAITYGTGVGQVRIPCDLMIEGNKLFVASTNNAAVEVYDLSCTAQAAPLAPLTGDTLVARADEALQVTAGDEPVLFPGGIVSLEEYQGPLSPPHMIDIDYTCGRCHSMDGAPDGGMLAASGQENLCRSCHTAGGRAKDTFIAGEEQKESHAWDVPASNPPAVPGPVPGSELALHLDSGDIRCGTCHEPHETVSADAPYLRGSVLDGGLCAECHKEVAEWQHAGHSDVHGEAFVHYDWSLPNRAACRRCHSGNGYIDFTEGVPAAQQNGAFRVLDCVVCHAAHGKPQDDRLLRTYDTVSLPTEGDDETLTGVGAMATCMACHNGRYAPDDGPLTPHYLLGGVMLEGLNGITFGYTLQNSPHTILANCMDCHMAATPAAGQPGSGKVGGHTFNMKVHDPSDPDFGFENVAACNSVACHGGATPLTTLNRTAFGDYDGDGTTEGVQDETQGLSDLVLAEIAAKGAIKLSSYPYWDRSGVAPGDADLVDDAIWNWQFVENSGDLGVHNTAYAVGLLQVTYKELTGQDVPNAFLRYSTAVASLSDTVVEIVSVNGGAAVQPDGAFTVNFTVKDDDGVDIPKSALNRLRAYVSGPATNYQRVVPQDSSLANFVENPDGSYTYTKPTPFPTVYAAPLNDSAAFGPADGELTGQALLDGTYTVLIEARSNISGVNKSGDATLDFVVDNDGVAPPALASRQVVTRDACNNCHNDLQIHGGGRFAVTGCVFCHNAGAEDYITNPESTAGLTINLHDMIHRLHRGYDLPRVTATANGADPYRYIVRGHNGNPADFSDVGFPVIPSGVTECAACHEGAAQGGQSFTTITRAKCKTCHDDIDFVAGTVLDQSNASVADGLLTQADLSDPTYRVAPGGITHAFVDDTSCVACHGPGAPFDVEPLHQHPTDTAQEGLEPAIDVVAVTGMTGGGGTYFQAGDRPEITFKLRNNNADPLQLLPGDRSVADRLEVIIAGPTTLYQNIVKAKAFWSNGNLAVAPEDWIDNFAVDGTYTYIAAALPANYPAQLNTIGEPPADQIFPYEGGWGQQYTPGGTPLDAGTYTAIAYGRRVTPTAGEREPFQADTFDFLFGAAATIVPYSGTVTTESCNACHGNLAFHGNQREGVRTCLGCHTAGTQDGGTEESVDLRIMVHKLHNARNLTNLPYELAGYHGVSDFSHLLISAMPGEAAECQVCHVNDDWKSPPTRDNMRTWMVVCTSCHDAAETASHVESATLSGTFVESCASCHGAGAAWSVERMHKSP